MKEKKSYELPDGIQAPEGWVLTRAGGRPRKEARDAAVFLADLWRRFECKETPAEAQRWIVESWDKAGKEASKGIGEPAHVRAAIQRAKKRGLMQALVVGTESGFRMACEGSTDAQGNASLDLQNARCWAWAPGMTEAYRAKISNLTIGQPIMKLHPIAQAVGTFFYEFKR